MNSLREARAHEIRERFYGRAQLVMADLTEMPLTWLRRQGESSRNLPPATSSIPFPRRSELQCDERSPLRRGTAVVIDAC
jgi:hypothetical protein